MGLFDDLFETAAKGGDTIKNASRTAQVRLQIRELEAKRKQLAAELGASLYLVMREQADLREGREALYDGIARIDLQLEDLERELRPVAGEPKMSLSSCPSCGAPIFSGAQFCSSCGTKIGAQGSDTSSADTEGKIRNRICTNCGYPNTADDAFCLNCGAPL